MDIQDILDSLPEESPTEIFVMGNGESKSAFYQSELLSKLGYGTKLIVDEKEIGDAKVFVICDLLTEPLENVERLEDILKRAKENGMLVCADIALQEDQKAALSKYASILPKIDFLFLDKEEAKRLTGEAFPAAMTKAIYDVGVKNVIMKDAENGCFVRSKDLQFAMGAIPTEVVDREGVSENFITGFIHGLFQEWQLKTCCEYASAYASISLGFPGALTQAEDRKYAIKKIMPFL